MALRRRFRDNVRQQAARVFELVHGGVCPPARGDQARSQLSAAEAQVEQAHASLEQARRALGPRGADNPQIREALAALEQVRIDLTRTTLRSPGDGVVTNLKLNVGQFAAAGRPSVTFLDARLVWLSAFLRENSLEYIKPGAQAEVALDVLPGRTLPARVVSVGWGVGEDDTACPGRRGWVDQAAVLVVVIATRGGVTFAAASTFADRLLILTPALGLLFFVGFAMRERAPPWPPLPATMLLNATAVVPVLTFQANVLGAGVVETLITAAARATLVVWLLHALLPAQEQRIKGFCVAKPTQKPRWNARRELGGPLWKFHPGRWVAVPLTAA